MIKHSSGYIAIISILIISAVLLTSAFSVVNLGIFQSKSSLLKTQFVQNYYLAQACAEEALMKLKDDAGGYRGSETIYLDDNSCDILAVEKGKKQERTIKVLSSLYNLSKKIRVEIKKINPDMEIKSWQELSDF